MSQTPGGLSNPFSFWVKANAGTGASNTGDAITTWQDNSPMGINPTQPMASRRPQYDRSNVNYNPSILFDGVNDYLVQSLGSNTYTSEFTLFSITSLLSTNDEGALFHNHTNPLGNGDPTSFQIDGNGVSYRYRNVSDINGADLIMGPYNNDFRLFTTQNMDSLTNTYVEIYERGASSNSTFYNNNQRAQVFQDYAMGINRINSSYANYYAGEFILFPNVLSEIERRKVETYLAVKYGITLDNTPGGQYGDYVATNNALLWDASLTPNYHNNVIGVGRDDAEQLLQKQSHTYEDSTRIYLNILQTANVDNTGIFNSDISYVLIGDNQGALCATQTANAELPSTLIAMGATRLEREWKLTRTNQTELFSLDIALTNCSNINTINPSQFSVLVDDDGNFSNAVEYDISDGLNFSLSGNVLSIDNFSTAIIPNNSTRYITIVEKVPPTLTISSINNICLGDSVALVFTTNSPTNIYYTDGTSTYSLLNVTSTDSVYVSPTVNTTYSVVLGTGDSLLLDCCVGPTGGSGSQTNITVHPSPNITANASDLIVCEGEQLTLTAQGGTNYTWSHGVSDGVPFVPSQSNTFHVLGENAYGCEAHDSVYVDFVPNINLFIGNDTSICNDESFTISSSHVLDNYLWSDGSTSSSIEISSGGEYTLTGNIHHCQFSATITIGIQDCYTGIYVPNSFSPDGDNINDTFFAVAEDVEEFEMFIFNRWGNIIFQSNSVFETWDGSYQGTPSPNGVYVYKIIARKTFEPGKKEILGHVTLLR